MSGLPTLDDAITWTRDRWANQRQAPLRLHTHANEGLGPFFTSTFAGALDGSSASVASVTGTVNCYHPTLAAGMSPRSCPECIGTGVKEHRSDRFLYPMSLALTKLHNSLGRTRQLHPYQIVLELAAHGWDTHHAAASLGLPWDYAEAAFLMALRRLHGFYAEGPVNTRVSWVDKSDAQRRAEGGTFSGSEYVVGEHGPEFFVAPETAA